VEAPPLGALTFRSLTVGARLCLDNCTKEVI
jgi:hypothetical protein